MSLDFYQKLPEITNFKDISNPALYREVPNDWFLVMTDVINSTIAIEAGRYKDVNVAGALAAIALANQYQSLEHPFLFGGDGITFLVPPEVAISCRSILADTRLQSKLLYDLDLRVAIVPVKEVYDKGKNLFLGKFIVSERYSQAAMMGDGFAYAEALLKDPTEKWLLPQDEPIKAKADFTGFTCRWRDIPSPNGETISLIVSFEKADDQRLVDNTLAKIEEILGTQEYYHPLREETLESEQDKNLLSKEATAQTRSRSGFKHTLYLFKMKFEMFISNLAMRFKLPIKAMTYKLKDLKKYNVVSSDFRKYDGSLKMVVSATRDQRERLITMLEILKKNTGIRYGYHISNRALLTCILHTGSTREVHFVDAADGGYAYAAKMLKSQN